MVWLGLADLELSIYVEGMTFVYGHYVYYRSYAFL
jgi:hypothetical protein